MDACLNKYNKYDYLIILLLSLLCFGIYGNAFQPVRVFAVLFIPFSIKHLILEVKIRNKFVIFFSSFCLFWIGYDILSLLWTPANYFEALKGIFYHIIHFQVFLLLFFFSRKAVCPVKSIMVGWMVFFLLTVPIALVELLLDIHLPISRQGSEQMMNLGGIIVQKKFSSVTFFNYNTYITVLCFVLPFLLTYILKANTRKQILFGWVLYAVITYIMLMNASRGGLLVLVISFIVFFISYCKINKKNRYVFSLIICFFSLFLYLRFGDVLLEQISYRFYNRSSFLEDIGRFDVYQYSLKIFLETFGIGVGVEGMIPALSSIVGNLGVQISHNIFLELLVQYGVLIFIISISFLWKIFVCALKNKNIYSKTLILIAIITFPIMGIINSGYLLMPSLWLYLSSLYIISRKSYD